MRQAIGELINRFKCILSHHQGKKVGEGQIIVMDKRNKPEEPIPGIWEVFECQRDKCKETYAELLKDNI